MSTIVASARRQGIRRWGTVAAVTLAWFALYQINKPFWDWLIGDVAGLDLDSRLGINDLVSSDNCYFAATGVTNGDMVRGVSYRQNSAITRSLVMRSKSGTIRHIESVHQLNKLQEYSVLDYTR